MLHWLESWLAHDMAYRLLADMRMRFFRKLVELGPAYLASRRTGDLLGVATHDIELIEYFFAHTITPGLVAVLVPAVVLATLATFGWPMALAVLPFLAYAALSPVLGRGRIDRLSARAREASGELNAHTVDSVQGLGEIVAFQQEAQRGEALAARAMAYAGARMPFLADLARQSALQEVATGLGGLAVTLVGAWLVAAGRLEGAMLPLLTLFAMSAFVPVWEIAQVGRQLADTLAATRRVHAVHGEPVRIADGPGVPGPRREAAAAIALHGVTFTYPGRRQPALRGRVLHGARGRDGRAGRPVRARARPRSRACCCASGTRTRAPSRWAATTCGGGASKGCAARSRWWPRTRISSTTRWPATSASRGRRLRPRR